jgi:PAS domain S-box-containing protein
MKLKIIIICLCLAAGGLEHTVFSQGLVSREGGKDGGVHISDPENLPHRNIHLTTGETAWLSRHPVIRVAGPLAFPPFQYTDEQGQVSGMTSDYIHILSERLGVRMEVQAGLKWPEVLNRARTGELDMVSCVGKSPDREAYLSFTDPYLSFPLVIITRREAPFIGGIRDLGGRRVACIQQVMTNEWMMRDQIEIIPYFVNTPLDALKAVSEGRAEAHIANLAAAVYLIEKQGLLNLKIAAPTDYGNYELFFAARKDWPELTGIVNKALRSIVQEEHSAIRQKWIAVRYEHGISPQEVWRWVLASAAAVALILGVIFLWNRRLSKEIHERRIAEEEIRRLRNFLGNIIDSMPSILVGVNPEGRVTQWNAEAEKKTGIKADQAYGQPLNEVLIRFPDQSENIRIAIEKRNPLKKERTPIRQENEIRYADITIYPLITNAVQGAVLRIDDVTERVRMEAMMIQSEKMMSVGGLAAGMAHEINNPLSGILQSVQNILRRLSPDLPVNLQIAETCGTRLDQIRAYLEQRDLFIFLENIHTSGARAAEIVSNMLNFSRRSDSRFTAVRLPDLLNRVLDLAASDHDLRKKYNFRQIEIVREFSPDVPDIPGSVTEIEQVILNLLKNSAQAMAGIEDSRMPRIVLRIMMEKTRVRIEVEDNGPGMLENIRKRIFEPFFTTKPVGEGTGLGLSVSYFIVVNNHNGSMSVDSFPGRGTRVTLRFPLERA